ncbi:adhesion G protein-coupled receptor L3-like isoform X2 [Halichondria panicea]|uniref:adhesion G protein-coupled receptor L3-like isoform X2 n=1 Tax=Halichondria panicea TaxID=6063 RepID=UPI00312B7DCB
MSIDADYNSTGHSLRSSDQNNVDAVQLRIVQPEHGGGLCNCWEISKLLVTFDGNSYFDLLNEESSCNDSQLTKNGAGPLQFCGGSAGGPRGVVSLPIRMENGQTKGCEMIVDGSVLVDKQPPPMNCETSNPRIELSYVLDLAPDGCDEIERNNEGIEVSLGNWDRDGDWIPLAYHDHKLYTNNPTFRIRDYDVPYNNCTGVQSFKISVCGDDYLRDGLQIRWLQQVFLYPNIMRDVVTLDNVSISLIVNETSTSLLEDGFDQGYLSSTYWNKEIRNGGVSTDCSGASDNHKIVFGLKCTTFGCENTKTEASRIATTVPLNITQLMPVPGNQSNTTISKHKINITSVVSMGGLTTSTEEAVMSTIFHHLSATAASTSVRESSSIQVVSIVPTRLSSASTSVRGSSTSSIQVASIMSTTGVSSASTSVRGSSISSIQVASIMSTTGVSSASTSVPGSSTSFIQVASIMSTTGVSSASTSVRGSSTSSIQVASIMSTTGVSSASTSVRGSSTSSIQVASIMSTTGASSASTSVPGSSTSSIQVPSIMSTTGVSSASTSVRGSSTSSIQVPSIMSTTGVSSASTSVPESSTSSIQVASIVSPTGVSSASTSVRESSTSSIQVASTPTAPATSSIDLSLAKELESTISNVSSIINENENLTAIKQKPPGQAAASLRDLVRNGTQVDRRAVMYLLSDMVNRASINDSQQFGQIVLEVSDDLLNQSLITTQSSAIVGSTLLATIEQLAFNVLSLTKDSLRTSNIELIVQEVEQDGNDDSYFTGIETTNSSIRVPTELVRIISNGTGPVTVASVYYRNMSRLLPGTLPGERDTVLASPVVSTSLQYGDKICDTANITLSQPVIVTLKHSSQLAQDNSEMKCVFWEFILGSDSRLVNGRWNTKGCKRNDSLSNSTHTVCECTHLTNFAILLSSQPIVGGVHAFVLGLIGYVGVSLSVLAMLATIVALVYLRSLWSMRNYIHINLCVSLILAQLMFVSGVTPHGGGMVDPGCRTAAVLMHYLFLVSFMWMLMEGVVLYVALVKVFVKNQKRYIMGFTIFSYGAPLLYMGLCVPLGFTLYPKANYGYGYVQVTNSTQDNETTTQQTAVCWLNPHGYFIQTFIVPVVLVILANIGFFIMALVIMNRHAKKQTHKDRIQKTKYWLKSSVSLVTIMGLTWIIGLLVFEVPALSPLAYIFTIFVAFQGVAIFVIFVPLSKQVREAYSKWWRVKVAESDILSSHFTDLSFRNNSSSVSNGKTISRNQRSSSNIYELESSILKSQCESKATFESSLSLDTDGTKTPDVTTPDYEFAFNITMMYPQDKSRCESKATFKSSTNVLLADTERFKIPDVTAPDYGFAFNITMIYPQDKSDRDVCIGNSGVHD